MFSVSGRGKRFIGAVVLAACFVVLGGVAWGNNENDKFAGGDGSDDAPFRIETWHHLNKVRGYQAKHFELIADLDEETDGYTEHVVADPDEPASFLPSGDVSFLGLKSTAVQGEESPPHLSCFLRRGA